MADHGYEQPYEKSFCAVPAACRRPEVLFLGSGVGLWAASSLSGRLPGLGGGLAVVDRGGLEVLTHVGNTDFPRYPLLRARRPLFGGLLSQWGVSAPRPPADYLARFPYPSADLMARFARVEAELGVPDSIPMGCGALQERLMDRLTRELPDSKFRLAPLAIDRFGKRWSPLGRVPELATRGSRLVARFHCTRLEMDSAGSVAVRGRWLVDGSEWVLRPRLLVLGLGVRETLPLLQPLFREDTPVEAADHLRIDLHAGLPADTFGTEPAESLGVAVILMEGRSRRSSVPYHLEIKVAPRCLWPRFMPSGDNLRGINADDSIDLQVQVIAAMHDRLPCRDRLNIGPESALRPVMSARDAEFHGELVAVMGEVARAFGIANPTFSFRPLLENHHVYGAFRVGRAVDANFRFRAADNLYILPPTSYVDLDDDANPTLKSLVLADYAMDAVAARLDASFLGSGQHGGSTANVPADSDRPQLVA